MNNYSVLQKQKTLAVFLGDDVLQGFEWSAGRRVVAGPTAFWRGLKDQQWPSGGLNAAGGVRAPITTSCPPPLNFILWSHCLLRPYKSFTPVTG